MKPARIESCIRLLIISFASLIILVFSSIGWLILLDAEDAIHDRYFSQTAADIAAGKFGPDLPKGISAHPNADFLKSKMQLREIPSAPGLHEIFANDELTRSEWIRTFSDRLRLWLILGYEQEFRLWIAPQDFVGNNRVVLTDLDWLPQPDWKRIPTCRRRAFGNLNSFAFGIRVPGFPRRWAGISRTARACFPGQLRNRIVAGRTALRNLWLELCAQPQHERRSETGSKYPEKCEKSSRVNPVFPNP